MRDYILKLETQKKRESQSQPEGNRIETDAELESIIDMRILDMLKLLEEYRRKCIKVDDDYIEAKRAEDKFNKV